jgi:hypothetical protein
VRDAANDPIGPMRATVAPPADRKIGNPKLGKRAVRAYAPGRELSNPFRRKGAANLLFLRQEKCGRQSSAQFRCRDSGGKQTGEERRQGRWISDARRSIGCPVA